jgi:hypothetical protein
MLRTVRLLTLPKRALSLGFTGGISPATHFGANQLTRKPYVAYLDAL